MLCNCMLSPISCLFRDRFSLEFRLLHTPHKPMKAYEALTALWNREKAGFSTSQYGNCKLIFKVNFQKAF